MYEKTAAQWEGALNNTESVLLQLQSAQHNKTVRLASDGELGPNFAQLTLLIGGWSKALLAPLKVWHLTKFWDDRG